MTLKEIILNNIQALYPDWIKCRELTAYIKPITQQNKIKATPTIVRATVEELAAEGKVRVTKLPMDIQVCAMGFAQTPTIRKPLPKANLEVDKQILPTTSEPKAIKPDTKEEPLAQPAMKRSRLKPFTPAGTCGYAIKTGKITVFLDRRVHSRSVTFTLADLKELAHATEKADQAV